MLQIEKGQDIKQELLQRYKTILPDELIEIWEDNGLARLLGGYLKVVNPEDYQELLKETYYRGNISVPILVTAFGDIVTFEEGQYIGMVKYKNGNFAMFAKNFKRFIQNLGDDYFLEKYFQIPQYIEAVNKLGKLEQDECFGYVPLLGLGGSEKVQNLKKVKIIDDNILNISKNFIENIFAKGFYACNEKDFDKAEQIATKLNINNMPELSKLFRSLSRSIDAMLNKKIIFNKIFTMHTISKIYNTIGAIENAKKNKDDKTFKLLTGEIKSEYIGKNSGEFIGLGAYPLISSSYLGLTSILYNLNSKKIYFFSHVVPTFYDNSKNSYDDILYNYRKKNHLKNNISIEDISKHKIKLTNYKINNEERISDSKKTSAILNKKILLKIAIYLFQIMTI